MRPLPRSPVCLVAGLFISLQGCAVTSPLPEPPARPAVVEAPPPAARPLVERVPTLTATGYAVIGVQAAKSPAQQRLLAIRAARLEAYRGLAEQVYGLYLDANTTVSEMTVTSDSFRSRVEGVIYGASLTSITPINNDTYEVTLALDTGAVNDLRQLYLNQFAARRR